MNNEDALLKRRLMDTCEEVVDLLLEKRHDYGTANIAMTGRMGLAVRMVDKSARLWNLSRLARGSDTPMVNETLTDTYMDSIGYALIGLNGKDWGLDPLNKEWGRDPREGRES